MALQLTATAHTPLKGWYSPTANLMLRAEKISVVKVVTTTSHFALIISDEDGQKQEIRFATLALLNEALDPLHLSMMDL